MVPFKLIDARRRFGTRAFDLLDVGCGNHSPSVTLRWLPGCRYSGLDVTPDYENDADDLRLMTRFYRVDLATLDYRGLPDAGFDYIVAAHVIEHLEHGDEALRRLVPKLRPGGAIYVEFPGERSLRLPSRQGCLNFHDDPTHVRLYTHQEVAGVLRDAGLRVVRAGTRRDWRGIALLPLRALKSRRDLGYVAGSVFWDLLGFSDHVVAEKPPVTGGA
jgi:SAM-dependent methyltransferase